MSFKFPSKEEMEAGRLKREAEEKALHATVCFTGHRPDKLGGCYSLKHPEAKKISDKLAPIIEQLILEEGISRFISGGAIGFDQIAFWTVNRFKSAYPEIGNIVTVPFKNQAIKWTNRETQHWYDKMLQVADKVICVDEIAGYGMDGVPIGDYHVSKMQKRNEYMVDLSRIVVACHDGSSGGTGNCVKYAIKKGKSTYTINPKYDYQLEVRYGMFH